MARKTQPAQAGASGHGVAAVPPPTGTHERLDVAAGLIQLSRLIQGIQARISERHHLTPVQAKLLCVLVDGPRGMAELAYGFGVEKAALTGLVDRVERQGLATRSAVPGDRRALHVTLTETGRRAARAFHVEATAELEQLLSPLAPDDRECFAGAVAQIVARCESPSPAVAR